MENVKQYVTYSGSSSLRGFFNSENVEFDPPSLSLRQNIMKAKAKRVYDLADGGTNDDEEREIRDLIISSENSYEIIRMIAAIGGWAELDNELPENYLDPIAKQISQVLDQRDYVVYQLIRRYLTLLDYNANPTLGDCFIRLLSWSKEYQKDEINLLLSRKAELLKGITSATMRERANMVEAARVHPDVIKLYKAVTPHRANDLIALMHEANYTTRICVSLVALDYYPLYDVIAEMIDPSTDDLVRFACRDTCQRLTPEFSAAAKAVELVGSNEAKVTVNRFMLALKTALDNFPLILPAPTVVGTIITALQGFGNTLSDFQRVIFNLPDRLAGAISLSNLLGIDEDDSARQLVSELHSQGWLARASFKVKLTLVNSALDGWTVDDDEDAILRIMEAAKAYDQAELYQLAAAATWESLDFSVDGDQHDDLEQILSQPV